MNTITIQEHLCYPSAIIPQSKGGEMCKKHMENLLTLLRKKLTEGSTLDVEKIFKEILQCQERGEIVLSFALQAELEMMGVEYRVKTRAPQKRQQHLLRLGQLLPRLKGAERKSVVYKVNCMILYDMQFQGFSEYLQHQDRVAVMLYKKGNYNQSMDLFERLLKNGVPEYHQMRRVWIGRILLECSDMSAFSWLFEVISDNKKEIIVNGKVSFRESSTSTIHPDEAKAGEIEKYEAKTLFVSGYRILCEKEGKDPEIAGVRNLRGKTMEYQKQFSKMESVRSTVKEYNRLKEIMRECSDDYKIANTEEALELLGKIPYLPKPSLEELDLRIELASLLVKEKRYREAKKCASICVSLASDLNVLASKRQDALNKIQRASGREGSVLNDSSNTYQQSKIMSEEGTRVSKLSKNPSIDSFNNENNHIALKDKNQTKHLRVENMENLTEESRDQEQEEEPEGESEFSQSNEKGERKSNIHQTPSKKGYAFQRKTIPLDPLKDKEEQPNCCLMF